MSDQMVRLLVGAALLLHGLGHGGALGALLWIRFRPGTSTGDWVGARSWLVPSLTGDAAWVIASTFWIVSLIGFVVAALSFWGILVPDELWKPFGVASAIVSLAGIVLFFGNWPLFNTLAALTMNVAVLVAVLWLRWPPQSLFGR